MVSHSDTASRDASLSLSTVLKFCRGASKGLRDVSEQLPPSANVNSSS
jgi:hypothetical protein